MNLKQLFAEEDAVSPVIGVILMVAITVILAAVIGTFVLGLGENVQDSAPQANFQFEYDGNGNGIDGGSSNPDSVTITHTGGEDIEQARITIQIGSVAPYQDGSATSVTDFATSDVDTTSWDSPVSTGSSITITETNDAASDTEGVYANADVRVIWTSASGGTSNTIGQSTVPS